jgi:hypothetical protein
MLSPLVALPVLPGTFARGLFVGVLTTAVVATLSFWVVQATGTGPIMMGDQGEQWTAQELRHLRKRGWKVINDVALKWWNTDHVIVGPGGAYAIESKWSATSWQVVPPDNHVAAGCRQVDDNARTMTLWLRPLKLGTVRPVLALWGANARELATAQELVARDRKVTVVAGPKIQEWLRTLPNGRLSDEQIASAWSKIDQQCRRRDAWAADDVAVPLSLSELGMRAVLAVLAGSASFLAAATWLATSPSPWLWAPALVLLTLPALVLRRFQDGVGYLVWGWLGGVAVTVVLLAWAVAKWMIQT